MHLNLPELADIPAVLAEADPELRARLYVDRGITLTDRPAADLVVVAAVPSRVRKCVSEGRLPPYAHALRGELFLTTRTRVG